MALNCSQIIALALEASHSGPYKTTQAQNFLNSVLSQLCQTRDLAAARGQFFFTFDLTLSNPNASFIGSQFGSGPYTLPVDYLRMSGSSGSSGAQKGAIWYLNGVPYPVLPVDLAEFDMQVQQAGLNSYPWLWATDMSTPIEDRIILSTTGTLTSGSSTITNLAVTNRLVGADPPTMGVAGNGIAPGTMLIAVDSGAQTATMTTNATESIPTASLLFGFPPVAFVYPPPSAALPVMLRYQRRMPDVFDFTRYPWFADEEYLIDKLTGWLCRLNDDSRADLLLAGPDVVGSPEHKMSVWLAMKDDDQNRPKRVELDRRAFGPSFPLLPSTKTVGW